MKATVTSLRRSNFGAKRSEQEAKFTVWVNANPARQAKYGEVLPRLQTISNEFYANSARDGIIRSFPSSAFTPLFKQVFEAFTAVRSEAKNNGRKTRRNRGRIYKRANRFSNVRCLNSFSKRWRSCRQIKKFRRLKNFSSVFRAKNVAKLKNLLPNQSPKTKISNRAGSNQTLR